METVNSHFILVEDRQQSTGYIRNVICESGTKTKLSLCRTPYRGELEYPCTHLCGNISGANGCLTIWWIIFFPLRIISLSFFMYPLILIKHSVRKILILS